MDSDSDSVGKFGICRRVEIISWLKSDYARNCLMFVYSLNQRGLCE